MLSQKDRSNLEEACQAVNLARSALVQCYANVDNPLLSEHVLDMLEPIAKMEQRLQRLISITESKGE